MVLVARPAGQGDSVTTPGMAGDERHLMPGSSPPASSGRPIMAVLTINGTDHQLKIDATCRCSGRSVTSSGSRAPSSAAGKRYAGPARCTSTAFRCARARRSSRPGGCVNHHNRGLSGPGGGDCAASLGGDGRAAVRLLPVGADHSAVALLAETSQPTDEDIDAAMTGNLCRCATYQRIRGAIHEAARQLEA